MQRIVVLDTETTGDKDHDQVMELAMLNLDLNPHPLCSVETRRCSTLVRPGVPCSYEARAVHHIRDKELEGAPHMTNLLPLINSYVGQPGTAVAAHNISFDLRLLAQSGVTLDNPVICTYKCARHLMPDAPRHSNQVLRYWLGLDDKYGDLTLPGLPPHRAEADTLVTSRLLMELLRLRTAEELVVLTTQPVLLRTCGFGKHAGTPWGDVPKDYLRWIVREGPERPGPGGVKLGFDPDTRHTAMWHLGLPEARGAGWPNTGLLPPNAATP